MQKSQLEAKRMDRIPWYQYLQLQPLINNPDTKSSLNREITAIEKIVSKHKGSSDIYII